MSKNLYTKHKYVALFASIDPQYKLLVESADSVHDLFPYAFNTVQETFEPPDPKRSPYFSDKRVGFPYHYKVVPLNGVIMRSGLILAQPFSDKEGENLLYTLPYMVINEFSNHKFDDHFWHQLSKPFEGNLAEEFIRNNYRPWWSYLPLREQWWLDSDHTHSTYIRFDVTRFILWTEKNRDWIFDPTFDLSQLSDEQLFIRKRFQYNLKENNTIVVKIGKGLMAVMRFLPDGVGESEDVDLSFDDAFYF